MFYEKKLFWLHKCCHISIKCLNYSLQEIVCLWDQTKIHSERFLAFTISTWQPKKVPPDQIQQGQRWGSGVREVWPQCRRRPQVYTSVKRVHSVWLHGQSFTKVHCVGPIHTPPTHRHSYTSAHTHHLQAPWLHRIQTMGGFWSAEPQRS